MFDADTFSLYDRTSVSYTHLAAHLIVGNDAAFVVQAHDGADIQNGGDGGRRAGHAPAAAEVGQIRGEELMMNAPAVLHRPVGSFLNVCIYRIPLKEDIVKEPSHCMTCGHKLAWYDNIPIVAWIALKGRCRCCGTKLSVQYPAIELLNAVL